MKVSFLFLTLLLFAANAAISQVSINTDGSPAHSSANLDVKSQDAGFLPPRMTTSQRNAVVSPAEGLVIYNTDEKTLNVYSGSTWKTYAAEPCGQPITDIRDGSIYTTVQIGSQCWMSQNLNIGTRINASTSQTNNGLIEKYCYFNDDAYCAVYGGLYIWDELMNYSNSSSFNPSGGQGICPSGWHLPSDAEFCQLENFLDLTVNCTGTEFRGTDAGGKLKETGLLHWASPNAGATNESGFTALPGGYVTGGSFLRITTSEYLWTSTESSTTNAWYRLIATETSSIRRMNYYKWMGCSARCVRD
jgi:uncharacterized protein (TIGR02145 family)